MLSSTPRPPRSSSSHSLFERLKESGCGGAGWAVASASSYRENVKNGLLTRLRPVLMGEFTSGRHALVLQFFKFSWSCDN